MKENIFNGRVFMLQFLVFTNGTILLRSLYYFKRILNRDNVIRKST